MHLTKLVLWFILWAVELIIGAVGIIPQLLHSPIFLNLPFVSFYSRTLQAIEILNQNFTLKLDSGLFSNFVKVAKRTYNIKEPIDEIRLRVSYGSLHPDNIRGDVMVSDSAYSLDFLELGNIIVTLPIDSPKLSEIKEELDFIVRQRLAIALSIFAFLSLLLFVWEVKP